MGSQLNTCSPDLLQFVMCGRCTLAPDWEVDGDTITGTENLGPDQVLKTIFRSLVGQVGVDWEVD